jgi:methylenetetrahydrofolate reductase (NADPH)
MEIPGLSLVRQLVFGSSAPSRENDSAPDEKAMSDLVANLHYEIVPMKSIDQAISDLPPNAHVSITCSPTKGIEATLEYTSQLIDLGHKPIPHIAARLVQGPDHMSRIAHWLQQHDVKEVFVIAGDAPEPAGPYEGALPVIRGLLERDVGITRIGVAGYPDGNALIPPAVVVEQLHAKQALLTEAGVGGWVSTQMCFDEPLIRGWLIEQREAGITLPVRLGVPGVVDRARLMTMGTRLGIGASLRFLSKNRSTVMQLLAPGGYDPTDAVTEFAHDADALGIEALHSFTFNAVADTRAWQEAILARASVAH